MSKASGKIIRFIDRLKFKSFFAVFLLMLIFGGVYLIIFLLSDEIELFYLFIFVCIECGLLIIALFIIMKEKYESQEIRPNLEIDKNLVLPKTYTNIIEVLNKLDDVNKPHIYEYNLLPLLKSLFIEKYHSKYNMSVYHTDYAKHLDERLVKILDEDKTYMRKVRKNPVEELNKIMDEMDFV